ncbi:lytic murein transglycosylase [Yunchengibacter salinarum]|uniref:lytic murein transglycosylase n=1 Tax=Yunchengibacter salinarum TaxID=3133399 RepID=UPI0035B5E184
MSGIAVFFAQVAWADKTTADENADAGEDARFQSFVADVRREAEDRGIKPETLNSAFENVTLLRRVISRDRNQPEVKQTYARYLSLRVSDWRKTKGREMMAEEAETLKQAGARFGVQPRFISAIWGIETNYGTVDLSIDVFDAVTTLAFDRRRAKRFRKELFAALEILDRDLAPRDLMRSSWAGAMGQPQFMPQNYLRLAVDQNEDGVRDIWHTRADVFASIANYLKSWGWRDDQTWGRVVTLPEGGETRLDAPQSDGIEPDRVCKPFKSIGAWRNLQKWQELGVRRANGDDLPARSLPAALIMGDRGDGKGYIVYRNFCSLLRYNPSFKYALAVGLLSDAIAGQDG